MLRGLLIVLAFLGFAASAEPTSAASAASASLTPVREVRLSWDDLGMGFILHTTSEGYAAPPSVDAGRVQPGGASKAMLCALRTDPAGLYSCCRRAEMPHRPQGGFLHVIVCLRL